MGDTYRKEKGTAGSVSSPHGGNWELEEIGRELRVGVNERGLPLVGKKKKKKKGMAVST